MNYTNKARTQLHTSHSICDLNMCTLSQLIASYALFRIALVVNLSLGVVTMTFLSADCDDYQHSLSLLKCLFPNNIVIAFC